MTNSSFFTLAIISALLLGSCSTAPTAMPNAAVTPLPIATFTPVPTETPIPAATERVLTPFEQEAVAQGLYDENWSAKTGLAHSETGTSVDIVESTMRALDAKNRAVPYLITGEDANGARYLWNSEIGAWTPERHFSMEYETAPVIHSDEVYDGSLRLSALLQYAENPGIIPPGAIDPHYKINVSDAFISINRYRDNQVQWPDAKDPTKETILLQEDIATKRSWGWLGLIRVIDPDGNEIVVMSDMLKNPVDKNPKNVLPRFNGFDAEYFLGEFSQIDCSDGLTGWQRIMQKDDQQIVTVYPYPEGWWESKANFGDNWSFNFSDFRMLQNYYLK